jgi:hypothetical protein
MRFMMIPVPRPAPAVHHIFMAPPRKPLHRKDGGEDDRGVDRERHVTSIDCFARDFQRGGKAGFLRAGLLAQSLPISSIKNLILWQLIVRMAGNSMENMKIDALMQNPSASIIAIIVVAVFFGMRLEQWKKGLKQRAWRKRQGKSWSGSRFTAEPEASFDATEQLRQVMAARFSRRAILNNSESRVFAAVEKVLVDLEVGWRVMAQVSLGEILSSPDISAYRAINSKRVDMLLVDSEGMPLHAIEYQGGGHFQGTAAARDAIKKEALRRAGIGYIEIKPGDTPFELHTRLAKLAAQGDLTGP